MKAIQVTQDLKDKNKLFEKITVGFIYSVIPKVFYNTENIVGGYDSRTDLHTVDGWRDLITPTLTSTQKLGGLIYDAANDVFTYAKIDKSPAELEQETAAQKEMSRAEIREKYQKRTVENAIALNPVDADAYFYQWTAGTYQIDQIRRFNSKTYRNTVANNTLAPDKGGWLEIK